MTKEEDGELRGLAIPTISGFVRFRRPLVSLAILCRPVCDV